MRRVFGLLQRFFLLMVLLELTPPLAANEGERPVTLGILAFRSPAQVQTQWQALGETLTAQLEQPVHIQAMDAEGLELAIRRREVDFILTNPSSYILLADRYRLSAPLCSLIMVEQDQPISVFGGVIFTRSDLPIHKLSDLAGRKIAVTFTGSFGGYQMQLFELMAAGLKPPDPRQWLLTGMPHDRVVEAVLEGKAEVGFVRTGLLERLIREGRLTPDAIRILNRQNLPHFPYASSTRLYPEWVFAGMPQVDPDLARRMTAALLALPHDGPVARQIGIWGFTIPMDYEPVREVLRTLRVPPFERAPAFTLADVWQRYHLALSVALGLASLSVGLLGVIWFKQRRLQTLNTTIRTQARELERRSALERQILGALGEGVYGIGLDGTCNFINPAALHMLGFSNEAEVLGQNNHTLFHHHHRDGSPYPIEDCPIYQTLKDGKARQIEEETFIRKDGSLLPVALRIAPILDEGALKGAVVAFHDITERKRLLERLRRQATHDELTGLINRRHLFELAEREHARIRRGNAGPAALIMLDVDHFKRINDTYGHLAGDAILRHLGQLLRANLRTADIAARYGGEEFMLLLPDTELDSAIRLAARLREEVAASQVLHENVILRYTLSLGITTLLAQDISLDTAIGRADAALYRAKEGGRNRMEVVNLGRG